VLRGVFPRALGGIRGPIPMPATLRWPTNATAGLVRLPRRRRRGATTRSPIVASHLHLSTIPHIIIILNTTRPRAVGERGKNAPTSTAASPHHLHMASITPEGPDARGRGMDSPQSLPMQQQQSGSAGRKRGGKGTPTPAPQQSQSQTYIPPLPGATQLDTRERRKKAPAPEKEMNVPGKE
jgi:hypothetical protein